MSIVTKALPLAALRGIAIDTETTGLDIKVARVIELAAVTLDGDQPGDAVLSTLIACDVPIPASSTAIHGLKQADLDGAPAFVAVWPAFSAAAGDRIWIGYAIGFDVAVLKAACLTAGLPWREPQTLDVRLLAQALEPRLPDFSLEALADWLKVPLDGRHRALADARLAAQVFIRLLPKLRGKGIHTVGDALGLCRRLSEGSAWPINLPNEDGAEPGGERVDSYPYRHQVRAVMSHPAVFVPPETLLLDAMRLMTERRLSSLFVGKPDQTAAQVGILTERDAMRAIAARPAEALIEPVSAHASRGLVTVGADAFIYRAIGRMARHKVRHLAVTGDDARIVGALSARDLLRLRASIAIELGDDIDAAGNVTEMGRAWAKLPAMAQALMQDDVPAREIAAIIAVEVRAATARAATLAEAGMRDAGLGGPPCPYAVLVLGSAGRGESLMAMDQDNALVFAEGEPGSKTDDWFAAFGTRLCTILDTIGIPLCKGGIMASQPAYRGSLATWEDRISHWLLRSNPADLLSVDIVFDLRPVHGDMALATTLRDAAWAAAQPQNAFLKLLAMNGEGAESPFGLFGGWKTGPDGRVDLKNAGLRSIVTGARVLALAEGHVVHSTHERLARLAAAGAGLQRDIEDLDRAHATILDAILRQQLRDLADGVPLSNRVAPATFDRVQNRRLRAALGHLAIIATLVRDRLMG